MSGIAELKIEVVKALSLRHRPYLRMNRITQVTLPVAQAMAQYWDMKFLELRGVREVDPKVKATLREACAALTLALD
ncbi:MAG: hypothetical protein ACI97A_002383 [Planctomycetota bacterium]